MLNKNSMMVSSLGVFLLCVLFPSLLLSYPMESLRVGSININGGRDRTKRAVLADYIGRKALDVIFLQETHSDGNNSIDWHRWWDGKCFLSHGTNFSAGVAILFSKHLNVKILNTGEVVGGRAMRVKAEIKGQVFNFVNVYAPNDGPERVLFFGRVADALKQDNGNMCEVLGGDWNCTCSPALDRIGEEPHSRSGAGLHSIMREFALMDVWRCRNPVARQYTWVKVVNSLVSAARLDRIYVSKAFNNKVLSAAIHPAGFTDHHLATIDVCLSISKRPRYYWHFNNKLLKDKEFCENFKYFWEMWRNKKNNFRSLSQWWEVGKAHIKGLCQQFTFNHTQMVKSSIATLEEEIRAMESRLGENDVGLMDELNKKKQELRTFLQERVKGALIRARILNMTQVDAPTAHFFNLEQREAQQKHMLYLRRPNGTITSDPSEMREMAVNFYADLYGFTDCDSTSTEEVLEGLPTIELDDKRSLDLPLSLQELTEAVQQLSKRRAPGMDGLSAEFYQHFWHVFSRDYCEMLEECFRGGELPVSCRRAVLSLLPKKGDLGLLENWRPISLMCIDYKILSKCLANRLKGVLDSIIQKEQSYCVPGRTIMDNLFVLRDIIDLSLVKKMDVGFLSVDQRKAFDFVSHDYLFNVLKAFGFGDFFISAIKLLYAGASVLLKVGGGLSCPVPVERGIRQGCPLSGQLYSLAIEPLLCLLRRNLNGVVVPGVLTGTTISLSAYADDVTVIISGKDDVSVLCNALQVYGRASSAEVNWAKCEGFLVGEWGRGGAPALPGGVQWGREGMKCLGVYLGTEEYKKNNWDGLLDKVCARMSRWNWLLPELSYRGRVLVVNNLAASTLWHRLTVLEPPSQLMRELQSKFVDFFWTGQHWLPAPVLYLPVWEGGQGLVNLTCRLLTLRLQAAQRLLYGEDLLWTGVALSLLREATPMGYDKQLFLLEPGTLDLNRLTPFYRSVVHAWQGVFRARRDLVQAVDWVMGEPLFHSSLLRCRTLSSDSVQRCLMRAGITMLAHLRNTGGWRTAASLQHRTGMHSLRLLERVLEEVKSALPGACREALELRSPEGWETNYHFPSLRVLPTVEEGEDDFEGDLVAKPFEDMDRKVLYMTSIRVQHRSALKRVPGWRWSGVFGPRFSLGGCWRTLYKPPIEKRTADLQWRLIHWAIATNRHVARLDPAVGENCLFCGREETVVHLFLTCERLGELFECLKLWFLKIGVVFSQELFISGLGYSVKRKNEVCLINFLLGSAKLAIWKTRKSKLLGVGSCDPLEVCQGMVAARVKIEYAYGRLIEEMDSFMAVWGVGGLLCHKAANGEVVLNV